MKTTIAKLIEWVIRIILMVFCCTLAIILMVLICLYIPNTVFGDIFGITVFGIQIFTCKKIIKYELKKR